ncbi:MAG: pyrimidine/purine nucleoside phosphorylase [Betaproteobacteria bacterium]|nr:pyrimidine/purine nucleoside phosphorylase [Betaproteobacteria bacterium]
MNITATLENTVVTTQANVYFDGKCVSYSLLLSDGAIKTVGVILPSLLTFKTGAPEAVEGVAGCCRVRLAGSDEWKAFAAGETFHVPGNSSFDIEVAGEPYHYICHFG